jgi:hypothetical protein
VLLIGIHRTRSRVARNSTPSPAPLESVEP